MPGHMNPRGERDLLGVEHDGPRRYLWRFICGHSVVRSYDRQPFQKRAICKTCKRAPEVSATERVKQLQADRRANGICTYCPAKARPGRVTCERCAAREARRYRAKKKQEQATMTQTSEVKEK